MTAALADLRARGVGIWDAGMINDRSQSVALEGLRPISSRDRLFVEEIDQLSLMFYTPAQNQACANKDISKT